MKDRMNQLQLERRKPTFMNRLYRLLIFLNKLSIYPYFKASDPNDNSLEIEECYAGLFLLLSLYFVFFGPFLWNSLCMCLEFLCGSMHWFSKVFLFPPVVFSVYRIIDLLVAHLTILFIQSEANIDGTRDGFIRIRHPQRWVAFLSVDLLQIVLSFATIYWVMDAFFSSSCMKPFNKHFYTTTFPMTNWWESFRIGVNAFYFSLVTIATLGSGDFYPTTTLGRLVVSFEILIGIFFLFFVFVIAVPTIKTTNTLGKKWK